MGVGSGYLLTRGAQYWLVRVVAVLLAGNVVALGTVDGPSSVPAASPTSAPAVPSTDGPSTSTSVAAPATGTTPTTPPERPRETDDEAATPPSIVPPRLPATTGDYTYVVTLSPTCARVGEPFTLTVRVEPGAAVGMIASHSDGDTHETRWAKAAGEDGVLVRTWLAPPAPGEGVVLTGATTYEGRTGGTPVYFRIVRATESC